MSKHGNFSISAVTTKRVNKGKLRRTASLTNLRPIPSNAKSTSKPINNTIRMGLLNVRSLNSKSFLVNDFITTSKLDFMFLTETWLVQNNIATVMIETAPSNYNFFDVSRSGKRGRGVAAKMYFRGNMLFGDFPSFEYLCAVFKCSPRVVLLIIYTPPTYSNFFRTLQNYCLASPHTLTV